MAASRRHRVPPPAVDIVLFVVAAAAGSVRELANPDPATKHLDAPVWVYVALQVVAAAALLGRRHRPFAAALAIAAISLLAPAWAALLVPYAVTAYGRGRWAPWAVIAVLVLGWLVGARGWAIDDPISGPALMLVAALLGLYVRARRALIDGLVDRAERAERERLLLAEQARADERVRLAGEMHDVVTHRINLMVLQAGALRTIATDAAVREAAEELRVAGCQALSELRDLVGILRTGDPPPARSPVRDHAPPDRLESLVDDSRAVGLPVDLDEHGDPGQVAPTVRRTLFRVVQESLTNVHKHAPGSSATVAVHYGPGGVRATVSNTPPRRAPDADLAAAGGGSGLDGLRHRVEVVGGTFAARPTADGGFAVLATLPAYVPTGARP